MKLVNLLKKIWLFHLPDLQKMSIFFAALIILVLFTKSFYFLDPDFGWHLTMGNLIQISGIPQADPFSYTMPSFPFVDHEWLTNVWLSSVYNHIGYGALAVIFTLIFVSTVFITISNTLSRKAVKKVEFKKRLIPFTLLIVGVILPYFGIRPQVQSWFLLSILLYLTLNTKIWQKLRIITPLLFLLWVNLHGSFAAGIATLVGILTLRGLRLKRFSLIDFLVIIASILATFVNPYSVRSWGEVWMQLSDTRLRWIVLEWQPKFFNFEFFFVAFLPLTLVFIWKYYKKLYIEEIALYLAYLFMALFTTRHVPLWVIVSIPILNVTLTHFMQDIRKIKNAEKRFGLFVKVFTLLLFLVFVTKIAFLFFDGVISEDSFYPKDAVSYLRPNLPSGNVFSNYGWGGYLIWKLPEKKVYIDGRMPSWRWNANLPHESNYAMADYQDIFAGRVHFNKVAEKYSIDTLLIPKKKEMGFYKFLEERIANILKPAGTGKYIYNFLTDVERLGWEEVYEDEVAVIYQRPLK